MSESTLSPELERERAIVRAYLKDGLKIGEIVQRFNLTGPNAVYVILRKADAPRFEQARAGKAAIAAAAATAEPVPEPVPLAEPLEVLAVQTNGDIELVKPEVPQPPTEKACSQCGQVKPLDDFHRMASMPDGRRPSCKTCDAEKQRIRDAKKLAEAEGSPIARAVVATSPTREQVTEEPAMPTPTPTENGHLDTNTAKFGHLKAYRGTRRVTITQTFELMAPDFLAAAKLAEDSISANVDTNDIDSVHVIGLSAQE